MPTTCVFSQIFVVTQSSYLKSLNKDQTKGRTVGKLRKIKTSLLLLNPLIILEQEDKDMNYQ